MNDSLPSPWLVNSGFRVLAVVLSLVVVGVVAARAAVVTGTATEVSPNTQHPHGNVYDQILLTGPSATVRCDPGQIARVSFIDLNNDIVQVEFSGAGTLAITLNAASGPAVAARYNQPGVLYMKGHASLEIRGSDATSNISIFSVGTQTALNPSLFHEGVLYDGIADLALLRIVADPENPNGSIFGGIRAGNAHFWDANGTTGIVAANVHVQDVVRISDVWAVDSAQPALVFGLNSQFGELYIAGGDLAQPNGAIITATGYEYAVSTIAGETSHGFELPRLFPRAQLLRNDGRIETLRQSDVVPWPDGPFIPMPIS